MATFKFDKDSSMRSLAIALCCVILTWTSTPLFGDEAVFHEELGFRLSVPAGFVEVPETVKGDTVYAFLRPPAADQKRGTLIVVSRLGGVLDREKVDLQEVTTIRPNVTLVAERWKGFDIDVLRAPEQIGDLQLVTFVTQVPLKPEAVQITVSGEEGREQEVRDVLRSVLGNLEGQTNWLNTRQRMDRLVQAIAGFAMLAVIVVIAVRGRRKRKSTRALAEPEAPPDPGRS